MGVCATGAGELSHTLGGRECSPAAALNNSKGVDVAVLAQLNLCTHLGLPGNGNLGGNLAWS